MFKKRSHSKINKGLARFRRPFFIFLFYFSIQNSFAVLLNQPDQTIKRIYPDSTRYQVREIILERDFEDKTVSSTIEKLNKDLVSIKNNHLVYDLNKIKKTGIHYYLVYQNKKFIGLVFSFVDPSFSSNEIFIAYDVKTKKIKDVIVQNFDSDQITVFRSKYYLSQFKQFSADELPQSSKVLTPTRIPNQKILIEHEQFIDLVIINILSLKNIYLKIIK